MKLFNETGTITEMWEEDKENKEELKKSSSIKRSKSKIAIMYENAFYNHGKLDSVKKNILGSLKGKRKITPTSVKSADQLSLQEASSSENKINDVAVQENRKTDNTVNSANTTVTPCSVKPCLVRGKTEVRVNRDARRHTEFDIATCRTQFAIPGEFLFCSHSEHNNTFASVYRRISSAGNLRRSLSTGTIARPESRKSCVSPNDSPDKTPKGEKKSDHRTATRSRSCVERSSCEKVYAATNGDNEIQETKRQSREILAGELQSIIDNKADESRKVNTCRRKSERETSFSLGSPTNTKTYSDNLFKTHLQPKTRNPTNRRSQSCKAAQKRGSHLFNISKYLKDRNTQRSKSFATIREFSTYDTKKSNSLYSDNKTEGRKSLSNIRKVSELNERDEQCIVADGEKRYLTKDIELTPIKTTRSFDINDTDSRGNSCLHHASSKGDISTIKYLLSQGGDVWVKNDDHRLPIDLAHNFQTAKLLSSATLFYSEQNGQRNERNVMQTSKLNIAL